MTVKALSLSTPPSSKPPLATTDQKDDYRYFTDSRGPQRQAENCHGPSLGGCWSPDPPCAAHLGGSSVGSQLALPCGGASVDVQGVLGRGCDLGMGLLGPDLPLTGASEQPQT